jgi:23S rRNA (cytosine1962-C5)-methyltransferase
MMAGAAVILKKGREESLRRRHPWVFSGALASVSGDPGPGGTVEVRTAGGETVGLGAFSPKSQIAVRIWTFDTGEEIGEEFFRRRIERAVSGRGPLGPGGCGRLVFSESDGLPGLIVDRYAEYLVCQFLSAGAERWKEEIVSALGLLVPCEGIYERSDVDVRVKEGLEQRTGVLRGAEPPDLVEVDDGGLRLLVDLKGGQKTGAYLDQRENREVAEPYLGRGEVLDCFCNTGSFTLTALKAGAGSAVAVDSSALSLALARRNLELNGIDPGRVRFEEQNVFGFLRQMRGEGRRFDAVVLDPPKFADARHRLEAASRGYKDINLQAMKVLVSGGILVTFSCSHHVSPELFQTIVAFAASDEGREVQILRRLHQSSDHPVALSFPESEYLKGLVCRVW